MFVQIIHIYISVYTSIKNTFKLHYVKFETHLNALYVCDCLEDIKWTVKKTQNAFDVSKKEEACTQFSLY